MKKIKEILDKKMKALRRKGKNFLSLEQTVFVIQSVYEEMINTMAIRQIMICTPKAVPCSHVLNHKRKKINPIFLWKSLRGRGSKVRIHYIAQWKNTEGMKKF